MGTGDRAMRFERLAMSVQQQRRHPGEGYVEVISPAATLALGGKILTASALLAGTTSCCSASWAE